MPALPCLHLQTPRLTLVAATLDLARADRADPAQLAALLDARLAPDWPPEHIDDATRQWTLDRLTADPSSAGWLAWYWVTRDSQTLIGHGGFTGPVANGAVEVGYSVVPSHQRQGYASEAVGALVDWALAQPGVTTVVADTLPALLSSQALLKKLGFTLVGPGPEEGTIRYVRSR